MEDSFKMYLKEQIGRVWAGFVSGCKPAADVFQNTFIRKGVAGGKLLCGSANIFSTLTAVSYLQQSIQVHMYPAVSERYLRFLGCFSIVGPQYGSHFVTLVTRNLEVTLRILENSSLLYKTKIVSPVAEYCFLPSVDCAMCI